MKIFSWNVNGLRAVMTKTFSEFVSECRPDVLCVQETRLCPDSAAALDLPFKYKFFSHADKKGYSGTAILSNVEPSAGGTANFDGHGEEGRITWADFDGFRLVSAYIPNSQDGLRRLEYRQKWDAEFRAFLKKNSPVVACGDFNVAHKEIDIARPDANRMSPGFTDEERADFTELLGGAELVDIWRARNPDAADKYTWWSYRGGARKRNVGWRIDYFLVSESLEKRVADCGICDGVLGSDHCPVYVDIK